MSESDGLNGPPTKRIKQDEPDGQVVASVVPSAPPPLSQQILQQVNAQNQVVAPSPAAKSREIRLEQNRKAARESRRRKKVMVEELQRSVIFFSRANLFLKQQHEEYSRMLVQAQATIAQMQQNGAPAPASDANEQRKVEDTQPVQQMPQPQAHPIQPPIQSQTAPIQPQTVASTQQQPQNVAQTAPISAEQAAQAQAVARAAAQQFAPQFAAMFGSVTPSPTSSTDTGANPTTAAAPSTPLQVAAANFQAAAAASLANGNLLGTYQTAFPGSGPYADAFQNAIFQQQAAAAAATSQPNMNVPPMNFGGPFQQAALAQHFGQNVPNNGNFPNANNGFVNAASPGAPPPAQSNVPAPAPTAEPATAST